MRHHSDFHNHIHPVLRGETCSRWYSVGVISHGKVTMQGKVWNLHLVRIFFHTNHAVAFRSSNGKHLLPVLVLSQCCLLCSGVKAKAQLSPVLSRLSAFLEHIGEAPATLEPFRHTGFVRLKGNDLRRLIQAAVETDIETRPAELSQKGFSATCCGWLWQGRWCCCYTVSIAVAETAAIATPASGQSDKGPQWMVLVVLNCIQLCNYEP